MIKFNEKDHLYTNDSGEEFTSVTTLLRIIGIISDLSNIPNIKELAEFGTMVHETINKFCTEDKFENNGLWKMPQKLIDFISSIKEYKSETILYDENYKIAGTADFVFVDEHNDTKIIDWKTGGLHKESQKWQLSIYAYMHNNMYNSNITTGYIYYNMANGDYSVEEMELYNTNEVLELLNCYRNGGKWDKHLGIMIQKAAPNELKEYEDALIQIQNAKLLIKKLEEYSESYKNIIIKYMRDNDIKSFESDKIKFTYVDATTSERVDSEGLKKDGLFDKYKKIINVSATLKTTIKKEKNYAN